MMFRNGTHMIDMMCFFAEANPEWLVSEMEPGFEHFTEYKGDGGHDPATDPYASAYIHFDNGVRAFYNCRKMAFNGSKFSLTCENGRIEISDQKFEVITQKNPTLVVACRSPRGSIYGDPTNWRSLRTHPRLRKRWHTRFTRTRSQKNTSDHAGHTGTRITLAMHELIFRACLKQTNRSKS